MLFLNRPVFLVAVAQLSVLHFIPVNSASIMEESARTRRPSFGRRASGGLPMPLSARNNESYAYYVVKHKNPRILRNLIKLVEKHMQTLDDEEMVEDFLAVDQQLQLLDQEISNNMRIRPLKDVGMPDLDLWQKSIDEWIMDLARETREFCTWFTAPFLLADCYFYRRLKEAFNMGSTSGKLKNFDYFAEQKENGLMDSLLACRVVAKYLLEKLDGVSSNQLESHKELFVRLMELSLWGNKVDLSHEPGDNKTDDLDPLKQLNDMRPNVLVNDSERVWDYLFHRTTMAGPGEIGISCDNASFELFNDMCLADFLLTSGIAAKVTFYVKEIPWFVSDVTEPDFEFLVDTLEKDREMASLGPRWRGYLDEGKFVVESDMFWTVADPFSVMPERRAALYRRLGKSRIIIFKGDLNYRKLVGDVSWRHTIPFAESLLNFHPAPIVALRTLKSDIVVGLDEETENKAKEADDDWMISGKYAVVQFCGTRRTLP